MAGSTESCPLPSPLPSDLQAPNRMLERGRLVRIALTDLNQFPVDQHVQVTTCFQNDCHVGIFQASLKQTDIVLAQLFETAKDLIQPIRSAYATYATYADITI